MQSVRRHCRSHSPSLWLILTLLIVGVPGVAVGQTSPTTRGWSQLDRQTGPASEVGPGMTAETRSARSGETSRLVKLQYRLQTPWNRVLRHVAEATGSQLVMQQTPPGRFARWDGEEYPRVEAVRILNQELEKVGFRLLEQGEYLVVLPLRQLRADYNRPKYQPRTVGATPPQQPQVSQPQTLQHFDPHPVRHSEHVLNAVPLSKAVTSANQLRPVPTSPTTPRAPASGEWVDSVTLTKARALDVARAIYAEFPKRSALVQAGPEGLPAFDVFDSDEKRQLQFRVGIDSENNRLVLRATPERLRVLRLLVQKLDRPGTEPARFVVAPPTTQALAQKLKPVLKQLAYQDTDPNPMPAPQGPVNPDQPGPLTGALKGDVNIQNVPGLGLVVTGNEKDVERVLEVIKRIETLSAGAVPEIRLRPLEHVNSEALTGLLTEVYERYTNLLTESVRQNRQAAFIAIGKPNAILILAPRAAVEGILALVQELDQPVDPTREFIVVPLRSAPATQLVALLEQFYEERGGLGLRAKIVADSRTNSLIIQASPRDLTEITRVIARLDRNESLAVNQMRILPLKNAVAEELAETIQEAIQNVLGPPQQVGNTGGGAGGQDRLDVAARSAVIHLFTEQGPSGSVIRSGLLTQIRVTADPRSNSLVVTAPKTTMPLMLALVQQLDMPTDAVAEIKVFKLDNADATLVSELLADLFAQDDDAAGPQLAVAESASSALIPLRFSVDTRTNSVIAVGAGRALEVVEAVVLRLDQDDIRERVNTVYRLKNSPAQQVADAINQFLDSQRDINTADPTLTSPFEQIEREVIVVPELVSNSLIISASPRYFEEIQGMVLQLDAAPAQVIIQALLVEVVLENTDELGVELGFQDSLLFDRSVTEIQDTITTTTTAPNGVQTTTTQIISQVGQPGFNFNNQPLGNNTAGPNTASLAEQALSSFGVGRVNGDLGFGGLVLSASSENISILLRALSQQRDVQILSRPQIRTLDNQTATIQVGQQVPIVNGVNVTALGVANPVVIQDEAGIILEVTPRINSDGIIVMEVIAEKSQFSSNGVPIFVQTDGSVITSPIKDVTTARATVSVPNNQTIVLGGMITQSEENVTRKVPWIADIPVLGQAFRYDSKSTRRTELLMFLTPRIIYSTEDNEQIKLIESERLHYAEDDAEDVHGPLFAIPIDAVPGAYGTPVTPPNVDFPMTPSAAPAMTPGEFAPPAPVPFQSPAEQGETLIDGADPRFLPSP